MTGQTQDEEEGRQGKYYIVAPGIWSGEPLNYFSLQKALRDFVSGIPFERIRGSRNDKKPRNFRIVEELSLSLQDCSLEGNIVSAKYSAGKLSTNQPFYLLRTYAFCDDTECLGYDVVPCANIYELHKKAITPIRIKPNCFEVRDVRNVLTRGLELKLDI